MFLVIFVAFFSAFLDVLFLRGHALEVCPFPQTGHLAVWSSTGWSLVQDLGAGSGTMLGVDGLADSADLERVSSSSSKFMVAHHHVACTNCLEASSAI